jgi:hypothetical protein
MVAVTYGAARVPAADAAARTEAAAPRKSWFARLMQSMMESRLEQARREIRLHTRLLPYTLDENGNRVIRTSTGDMPFGGW